MKLRVAKLLVNVNKVRKGWHWRKVMRARKSEETTENVEETAPVGR